MRVHRLLAAAAGRLLLFLAAWAALTEGHGALLMPGLPLAALATAASLWVLPPAGRGRLVLRLVAASREELDRTAKLRLTEVLAHDLPTDTGASPVSVCIGRAAQSLAQSYEQGKPVLWLPPPPPPLALADVTAESPS